MELTKKEQNILNTINNYIKQNEIPPTIRKLGDITGLKCTWLR
ncbi:hypothetical protein KQI89_14555 [Clostridium sp. MSJ-4]|uniref:LexA repressor DNA-binding domain-containing protein n=1 Tax=Clostridium simiarum TaxID=2841506 RepID=A0ABS6F3B6_9CLOT|nr:hypothetical protein [Clostridium simiarum]MBU5592969.1 hypothetical protein [Clostridium simiarum]